MNTESTNVILKQLSTVYDNLTLFKMQISTLQHEVKRIEKTVKKELKQKQKKMKMNKKENKGKGQRLPSGFAKPSTVTKELCDFMDKPEGTEIARTEVTKALFTYIKENNLIEQGKKIVPDEKLKRLLGIEDIGDLTYFTIQKYMNKHFVTNKKKELEVETLV